MVADPRTPQQSLATQTAVYGIASAAALSIPILLAPILTFYLRPEDYGVLMLFDIAVNVLTPVVGLGTQGAIRRKYFDVDNASLSTYVSSALRIVLVSSAFWTFVLIAASMLTSDAFGDASPWLLILIPWMLGHYALSLGLSFLQLERKALRYGLIQAGMSLTNLGVSLLLVIGLEMAWQGRLLGQVGASVIFALLGIAIVVRRVSITRGQNAQIKEILAYGGPTVANALLDRITALTDRALVITLVGLGAGGVYALASQVAALLVLAMSSFTLAWHPWLFEKLKTGSASARQLVVRSMFGAAVLCVVGGLVLAWLGPILLPYIIHERFLGLLEYLPWLCGAFVLRGFVTIGSGLLLYERRTGAMAKVTVLAALVNVAGNLVLIPAYGAKGAALATCLSFAVAAVLMGLSARRAWLRITGIAAG